MLKRVLPRHVDTLRSLCTHATEVPIGILSTSKEQEDVKISGWATSVHKKGQMVFVKVADGRFSKNAQVVVKKELANDVKVGCPVSAKGNWVRSQGAKQEMELMAYELQVLGNDSNARYDVSADNLRKKLHLRARSTAFSDVLVSRSIIFKATHDYFIDSGFVHIDTPKLTKNDCEGGGEVFEVTKENEDNTNLSVSSQLHLEAMTCRLSQVYTLTPAFRAEKQQSHAHLSEFHMIEIESAFVTSIDGMCDLVEDFVKSMMRLTLKNKTLVEKIGNMSIFQSSEDRGFEPEMSESGWPRIEYSEAVSILEQKGQKVSSVGGLSKQNELALVDHFKSPVFVTHFPSSQKPFYMARDGHKSLSFDLLCPLIGELAGGSVREHSSEELRKRGCNIEWYLELRDRGQPPTAGFGIGFERLLQFLFSIRNIKDTISFPRWHKHCQC